jgi:cell division protein FtsN
MCDSCGLEGAVRRLALDRADVSDKPPPKPENVVSPEKALPGHLPSLAARTAPAVDAVVKHLPQRRDAEGGRAIVRS